MRTYTHPRAGRDGRRRPAGRRAGSAAPRGPPLASRSPRATLDRLASRQWTGCPLTPTPAGDSAPPGAIPRHRYQVKTHSSLAGLIAETMPAVIDGTRRKANPLRCALSHAGSDHGHDLVAAVVADIVI